jgi:sigma-B regulation protein RsbU (phosphoserine phosphatase)
METAPLLLWTEMDDLPTREVALDAGDRVVFYTDGVTDRRGPDEARFDTARLARALAGGASQSISGMIDHLADELDRFAGGIEPDDDQTVLAFEISVT